jgi:hypothetical protein
MHVRINEAGQYCVVAEINRRGTRPLQPHDGVTTSSRNDPAIPDRDRFHDRIPGIHRVDAPGEKNTVSVPAIESLRPRCSGCSNGGGEKAPGHPSQDVTTAMETPHDIHEAFVAGVTHGQPPLQV